MTGPDSEGLPKVLHIFERATFQLGVECTTLCGAKYVPTGFDVEAPRCEACAVAFKERGGQWLEKVDSPVVPSVGAVPVEVPEEVMQAAQLAAQAAALDYDNTWPDVIQQAVASAYPLIAARVQAEAVADERVQVVAELEDAGLVEAANLIARCTFADDTVAQHDARVRAEERQRIEAELIRRAEAADRADLASIGDALDESQCRHGHRADTYRAAARVAAGSAVPVATPERQEFCGTLPGHPPHGNCGGYPPSVATPTEPGRCSRCGFTGDCTDDVCHGPVATTAVAR